MLPLWQNVMSHSSLTYLFLLSISKVSTWYWSSSVWPARRDNSWTGTPRTAAAEINVNERHHNAPHHKATSNGEQPAMERRCKTSCIVAENLRCENIWALGVLYWTRSNHVWENRIYIILSVKSAFWISFVHLRFIVCMVIFYWTPAFNGQNDA